MMATNIAAIEHIVEQEGYGYTRAYIAGRRIAVDFIVILYVYQGAPIEEIVEGWELTPGQIYAALSYYYDHKEAIDSMIQEQMERDAALAASEEQRQLKEEMRQRLAARKKDQQDD